MIVELTDHPQGDLRKLVSLLYAGEVGEEVLSANYSHLLNDHNPLLRSISWKGFVAKENGRPLGEVVASVDDRLRLGGEKTGTLGCFECEESFEVVRQLIRNAMQWLYEQDVKKVIGPINFNTWNQYRFIVERAGDASFYLEPYHKEYYSGLWEAAGFKKRWDYYSGKRTDFSTILPYTKPAYDAALKEGFVIRSAYSDSPEKEMRTFHDLTVRIFKDNIGFVPISLEEYAYIYGPLKSSFDPRLTHFLEKDGKPIGYSYSLADQLNPNSRCVILKTIGLLPEWQGKHLGAALAYAQHLEMQREGFEEIVYALIAEGNAVGKMEYPGASTFRRYALYEIDL